ncbi:hypothetical protein K450DRAFT_250911 [Umbelopsis ramanniana AG]|uniref:Uncharacterized protein n=1 Tax=Umbelopsis ramanniana AG TaxID=1314678 RepID=A0AAD5HCY3_UMBRA|nr:uncharacterized protein K450DRAFT_250911 [Umbelopsis ramanniana AG]KAI8577623.1 hypothetical protein K450DRAFT_250911 [Umbelopsis ramanniana AG]
MPRSRHVLALLIVIATISTGFYVAYDAPERLAIVRHEQAKAIVPIFDQSPITNGFEQEQYITYLPHSGFQAQRIAFENAIMVAHYTNRTLIAPMARLGANFDFGTFDQLRERYLSQTLDSADGISVSWSTLFDLEALKTKYNVRIIEKTHGHTDGSPDTWIGEYPSPDMIHFINKTQALRSWKIYDKQDSPSPLGSYNYKLTVDELKSIDSPLLYFGSMWGGARVMYSQAANQAFQTFLRQHFKIVHPALTNAADTAIYAMGGVNRYVALQVLSVGRGKTNHDQQLDNAIQSLLSELDLDEMLMGDDAFAGRDCLEDRLSPKLYLATDLSSPYSNPIFTRLRSLFPCAVAYQDLVHWDMIQDPLANMTDDYGRNIGPYFVPLVDGIIASKAAKFFSQQGSGYGQYFQQAWQIEHR